MQLARFQVNTVRYGEPIGNAVPSKKVRLHRSDIIPFLPVCDSFSYKLLQRARTHPVKQRNCILNC